MKKQPPPPSKEREVRKPQGGLRFGFVKRGKEVKVELPKIKTSVEVNF